MNDKKIIKVKIPINLKRNLIHLDFRKIEMIFFLESFRIEKLSRSGEEKPFHAVLFYETESFRYRSIEHAFRKSVGMGAIRGDECYRNYGILVFEIFWVDEVMVGFSPDLPLPFVASGSRDSRIPKNE